MTMYPWLASACAPEAFPVRLMEGRFLVGAETIAQVPRSVSLHNGWGEAGLVSLGLQRSTPLPERLTITWFSLAEDRFYGADFDLPIDKLATLFDSGFVHPETGAASCWSTILIGMAPGGRLALWLTGGGLAVELCRAMVPVQPFPWALMPASEGFERADYVHTHLLRILGAERLEQLRNHPIDPEVWDRRQARRRWGLEWIGAATDASVRLRCRNAEREHLDGFAKAPVVPARLRGLPESMVLRWSDKAGLRRVAHVKLDSGEVQAAFGRLTASDQAGPPLTLQVGVTDLDDGVRMYLCDPSRSLELLYGAVSTYLAA